MKTNENHLKVNEKLFDKIIILLFVNLISNLQIHSLTFSLFKEFGCY